MADLDLEGGFVSINVVKNRRPIILPLVSSIVKELYEYITLYNISKSQAYRVKPQQYKEN